jgi:putrescine transport system permease protein
VTPEINAACTILIAVVAVGVIIAAIATKKQEAQRIKDEQMALRN